MTSLPGLIPLAALEAAINTALRLDPETLQRLRGFEGRVVALEFRGAPLNLYLLPGVDGVQLLSAFEAEPDTTLSGTPLALLRFGTGGGGLFGGEITIRGDVELGQRFKALLEGLQIDRELLPDCYESPEVSSRVRPDVAAELGIPAGTPIVGGGGDQAAGAVGNGIVKTGVISATIGTSGVVFAFSDAVATDPKGRVHTFCHAVPGKWHVMGVMLSAGGSFQWYRNALGEPELEIVQVLRRHGGDRRETRLGEINALARADLAPHKNGTFDLVTGNLADLQTNRTVV